MQPTSPPSTPDEFAARLTDLQVGLLPLLVQPFPWQAAREILTPPDAELREALEGLVNLKLAQLAGTDTWVLAVPEVEARRVYAAATTGRACRVCGCSEFWPCDDEDGPCAWVTPDLCSACEGVAA